jgi:hypothetical protein
MKKLSRVGWCSTLVISVAGLYQASIFVGTNARAETPQAPADAAAVVTRTFLEPLAKRDAERPKFSRMPPPPDERKVRITAAAVTDATGAAFQAFAVDARRGETWTKDVMAGCVYPSSGAVYVRSGEDLLPAAAYLGQKWEKPAASTCRAPVRPPS